MITCPNCGKENQTHYKFCLACGSKLPPEAPAAPPPPPPSAAPSPPPPPPSSLAATGPADPALPCPSCEFVNPPGFKFCGRCGAGLGVQAPPQDVGSANTIFVANEEEAKAAGASVPPRGTTPPPPGLTPGVAPSSATAAGETSELQLGVPAPGGTSPGTSAPQEPATEEPATEEPAPEEPATAEAPVVPPPATAGPRPSSIPSMGGPSHPGPGGAAAKLIMLGPDGQPIGERILSPGESLQVGRTCGQPWEDDAYLDPKHAKLTPGAGGVTIEDDGSLNGIYLKLSERVEVQNGDQFRVGQELLLYQDLPEPTPTDDGTERMGSPNPGYWGRLSILVDPDHPSAAFPITGEGIEIGREEGEIQFPDDGYVSGKHCRVFGDDDGVYVEDLGSSNGTYMRVRDGQTVAYGSLVLIGQKLFELRPA